MNRTVERVLLAAVVLGLFVPGAVRLADPFEGHDHSSSLTIDDSQPPAEMAYDAMMQTERHSYTVTATVTWFEQRYPDVTTHRIDNANHQALVDNRPQENTVFRNEHTKWETTSEGGFGNWSQKESPDRYTETFRPQAVRNSESNVTVIRSNQTVTVLRVNNNTTVSDIVSDTAPPASSVVRWNNLTLHIDRNEQVLRRAVFQGRNVQHLRGKSNRSRIVYRFSRWDETTVDRPRSIPYTLKEIVDDIRDQDDHHRSSRASASNVNTVQPRGMA